MEYQKQVQIIRELSKQLRELSQRTENRHKAQLWADHNDLKENRHTLLWICPDDDGGWLELVPPDSLQTEDADLRGLEMRLRKYLYHGAHFQDDFVFEPLVRYDLPGEYTGYQYGDSRQKSAWGIPIGSYHIGKEAYHLENYLESPEQIQLLLNHEVDFIPDEAEHRRLKEKLEDAVDGIIQIQFHLPYSVLVQSLLIELVHLRGLENLMFDLYDNEELLHQIMDHMSQSKARLLERLEENRMLFDNRTNLYTGSGGLGYSNVPVQNPEAVKLTDMWGFADAQEFSNVSAQMFRDFALQYQQRGLNKFGLMCYGCCEPLDDKFSSIFELLPGVRRLSVSPWSNVALAAEAIGRKAIFSWKPNPSKICTGFDPKEIEPWLREVAHQTRDCYTEIILKDIRTCGATPQHLQEFCALVKRTFQ